MKLLAPVLAAAILAASHATAHADSVTDWNMRSGEFITEAKLGTPPAVRLMALVQTAVHHAATDAARSQTGAARATAIDAAVAAAHRTVLVKLLPAQQAGIASAYTASLAALPEGAARTAGVAAGEKAAEAVLAARGNDGAAGPGDPYRPHAAAGAWVPTTSPAAPHWAKRKPWLLAGPDAIRPPAPPPLASATWARDFAEVKRMGSKASSARTADQTEAARFWEYSLPSIYFGVLRSVASAPSRDVLMNARLYAAAAQAMDDALITVFDAKYHYHFWRPVTAIRNGDQDGNDATERDASWSPLIDAPLHPEYPSAHAILAGAVGTLLQAEVGPGAAVQLSTSSPTAEGATRRWKRVEDFVQEVADARVWEGIHYRFSTEAGLAMGRRIGELAVMRFSADARQAQAQ